MRKLHEVFAMPDSFSDRFKQLQGNNPFPWQTALFDKFVQDEFPQSCSIPTGLGKTAVLAIWFLAWLEKPDLIPRRLVYVVNRRTVVDQTTTEAENIQKMAQTMGVEVPAISTLRGQLADNREWSADPSKPAIICGTVDMIGSRLLFSGYGVGFKGKPLHAGFLGQDVLLVHDEAHLEPAFQDLLADIEKEQKRCKEFRKFRVMELTATSRGTQAFSLSDADREDLRIDKRINAPKAIVLHPIDDERKALADKLVELALVHRESQRAILLFARSVEAVTTVVAELRKAKQEVQQLTGTLRGLERDQLADDPIFRRFLPKADPGDETVYLVCTSAGEVGVNISADHLACDLSTFDSMAQRFGRVNRFGDRNDTRVDIVHPTKFDEEEINARRSKTLGLLMLLEGNGSPAALAKLPEDQRLAAFAPPPTILPVSDILFDAWALTTIKEKLPGRPPVEPYLHGISVYDPPQTTVAWREEVWELRQEFEDDRERKLFQKYAAELLEDYPLKAHETLADRSDRVLNALKKLEAKPETPVWIVDNQDAVTVTTLGELIDGNKDALNYMTVLLPPIAGGLEKGLLISSSKNANDVADQWFSENGQPRRARIWDDDDKPSQMRLVRTIDTKPHADPGADESVGKRYWHWFEIANEGGKSCNLPVTWEVHVGDVVKQATAIVANLPMEQPLKDALIFAARFHDHGKRRKQFQTVLGNYNFPAVVLAKSGKKGGRIAENYRHEFGSLLDVQNQAEFKNLAPEYQELVLHLIATHHGRARPHFPEGEDFDPEHLRQDADNLAVSTPRRFALLQRKYGRWGLAYIESLLRAADWAASANPSAFVKEGEQ
ncbi:MAG: type I-U CRISPR-associated helicase/endonuclease Cas3 [Gemmataceae bacterium]|nr:type I-U CRISPR-associated helicase/endonuclease Cas3 [Gemmataceae bacterium]